LTEFTTMPALCNVLVVLATCAVSAYPHGHSDYILPARELEGSVTRKLAGSYGSGTTTPAPPAPTPAPAPFTPTAEKPTVTIPTTLKGFTIDTFTTNAQLAVRKASAESFGLAVESVQLTDIKASARRRLAASEGVTFNVVAQAASPTQAASIEKTASASTFSTTFTGAVETQLAAEGVAIPTGFAATTAAPVLATSSGGGSSSKVGLGVGLGIGLPALAALVYFGMKRNTGASGPATDNTKGFAVTQSGDDVDAVDAGGAGRSTSSVEMASNPTSAD
jgi:hypothetical protein